MGSCFFGCVRPHISFCSSRELRCDVRLFSFLSGMQIFHNYMKPRIALKGKTPAEFAEIQIQGENKWITLIQNASKAKN
jgi:hypothetical protein